MTSQTDPKLGLYRCPDYDKNTFSRMDEFRKAELFFDVVLECDSVKFPTHRVVLASSSEYFRAKFTRQVDKTLPFVIQIVGINVTVLRIMIEYIYTREILITEDNIRNIHLAAKLLRMENIREACCDYLQARLQLNNCFDVQLFANVYDYPDILANTTEFIDTHISELFQQDEFLKLTAQNLGQLIFSNHLPVSEDDVFQALICWVDHDKANRIDAGDELCSRIRFSLLSHDKLICLSQSKEFMTMYPSCKDDLVQALGLHLMSSNETQEIENTTPHTPVKRSKVLMVFGGWTPGNVDSVEEYNLTTGFWQTTCSILPTTSSNIECPTVSPTMSSSTTTSSSTLSEISGRYLHSKSTTTLPKAKSGFGVCVVAGLIYVIGGNDGVNHCLDVDILDPINNIWYFCSNMSTARSFFGVAILDGQIYVMGGVAGNTKLDSAEVLDIWSGSWKSMTPMSGLRGVCSAAGLSGKIFAVGKDNAVCFDRVTATWSNVSSPNNLHYRSAVCALDNRLYVVGGCDNNLDTNTAEVYTFESDSWQRVADLNIGRYSAGLVAHNGCLYVVGGERFGSRKSDERLDSIEKYNPLENSWTLLPNRMSVGRNCAGVAVIERVEARYHSYPMLFPSRKSNETWNLFEPT